MKKIKVFLLLMLLLGSMIVFPEFTETADANIGQHEATSGVCSGVIENVTYPSTNVYYFDTEGGSIDHWANGENLVDNNLATFGTQDEDNFYNSLDSSTYLGEYLGNITSVEIRAYAKTNGGDSYIGVRAWWNMTVHGNQLLANPDTVAGWTDWQELSNTSIESGNDTWNEDDLKNLDLVVRHAQVAGDKIHCAKVELRVSNRGENFDVTRTTYSETETLNFSFTPSYNYSDNVTLKIPTSTDVSGIVNVTNNTAGITATEVDTMDALVNNTFWYDSANQFVYIRTVDIITSTVVNWTIGCSYDVTFNLIVPSYLEVGQYFHSQGRITDGDGYAVFGAISETRLLDGDGNDALSVNPQWNCSDGNYRCVFSTSSLIPGIYNISIEITDPNSGITFKEGSSLYLSVDPGPGMYISTLMHFAFYNNNTGIGIPSNSFKIYASDDTTISPSDRIYTEDYKTYTGQTIYYRINDYFNNQIYPSAGLYETVTITKINEFIDIPINWYDLAIKNMNESIMHFSMSNSSRFYNITLFPMDSEHIDVLPGEYNVTKTYYSASNGTLINAETDTITITEDTFYVGTGYTAVVHISWYNTNEGLGLPDETLKLYIDGFRQLSMTYYTYIDRTINITVKDYYNTTLYINNHTITDKYSYFDLGLTFHSYKFCNKNGKYYMVSFLKSGGLRWWEVGCCPYETIEFLIPSGTYQLRIYDADWSESYNQSASVLSSKVYVISGTNLSEIIAGQSVIVGQLLELRSEFDYATMPDIQLVVSGEPYCYSIYDTIGAMISIQRICPALVVTATTRNSTTTNCTLDPLIPGSDNDNGTIRVKKDIIYFEGSSANWVCIKNDAGTVLQNTSYIPNKYYPTLGLDVNVSASNEINVTRETTYQSQKKFYWTKYTDTNYYSTTVTVENPLDDTIREVYTIIEFANDTTPDYITVEVYDVTNGVYLTRGENYETTASGIHFYLDSLVASGSRRFTCSYYSTATATVSSDSIVVVDTYDMQTFKNKNYYHLTAQYVNDGTDAFIGNVFIQFNFDTVIDGMEYIISSRSIEVYDNENNGYLDRDEFIYLGTGLSIKQSAIGSVAPNGARTFDVYFLFINEEEGDDVVAQAEIFLKNKVYGWVEWFHVLQVVLSIGTIGIALIAWEESRHSFTKWKVKGFLALILGLVQFLIYIWYINA